jgi:hypothetical protein
VNKQLYAVAISAHKGVSQGTMVQVNAMAVVAASEEEAIGAGVVAARKEWPSTDWWTGHEAAVVLVPKELMEKVDG